MLVMANEEIIIGLDLMHIFGIVLTGLPIFCDDEHPYDEEEYLPERTLQGVIPVSSPEHKP